MTENTNEQNSALASVKYPAGWNRPNPSLSAEPFAYNSSYTNPAFLTKLPEKSEVIFPNSNQFNSSLVQRPGQPAFPYQVQSSYLAGYNPGEQIDHKNAQLFGGSRFDLPVGPIGIMPPRFSTMPVKKPVLRM